MFPFRPVFFSAALLAAGFSTAPTPLRAQVSLPIFGNRIEGSPLENRLAARTSLTSGQLSLAGFAELLRKQFSINAMLDRRALDDVGVGADSPLSACDVSNVVLEDAIELVLGQLDLTIMVRDEVLVITTPEEAENNLETHVYPVADLLCVGRSAHDIGRGRHDDYDTLLETITSIIAPDTWDQVGGAGSIEAFPASRALVISATRPVHRQIGPLLETLRKAKTISFATRATRASQEGQVGSRPYTLSSAPPTTTAGLPEARFIYRPSGNWREPRKPD